MPVPLVSGASAQTAGTPRHSLQTAAACVCLVLLLLLVNPLLKDACADSPAKPNIILINLDDADFEMFTSSNDAETKFPTIINRIAKQGMTFTNMHVTTPLCGPSRACLYRGQYAHNLDIRFNGKVEAQPGVVCSNYQHYQRQGFADDDLSVWMKQAGYRTLFVGKYIHNGPFKLFEHAPPPGWDEFQHYLGSRYYQTYYCKRTKDPVVKFEQLQPGIYRTHHESDRVIELLKEHAAQHPTDPFFLNVNPLAPHAGDRRDPGMYDKRFRAQWLDIQQPPTPAYDEADTADKRGGYAMLPPMDPFLRKFTKAHFRERQLATRTIDELVKRIFDTLNPQQLNNTYIFFTSDNGFSNGHHRLIGKGTPTDRSSRVPLMVCGPGIQAGQSTDVLLGHIDLAPTIVELAGGKSPASIDGRSFAQVLNADTAASFKGRSALLIENWQPLNGGEWGSAALRTQDAVYTEWANGGRDYFDLSPTADPQQLNNSWEMLSEKTKSALASELRKVWTANRAGSINKVGRDAEYHTAVETIEPGDAIRGFAEAADGVDHVLMTMVDNASGLYFNGKAWQSRTVRVAA